MPYPVGIVVDLDGQVLVHGAEGGAVFQIICEHPFVHHVVAEGVEQLNVNVAHQGIQSLLKIRKISFSVLSAIRHLLESTRRSGWGCGHEYQVINSASCHLCKLRAQFSKIFIFCLTKAAKSSDTQSLAHKDDCSPEWDHCIEMSSQAKGPLTNTQKDLSQ